MKRLNHETLTFADLGMTQDLAEMLVKGARLAFGPPRAIQDEGEQPPAKTQPKGKRLASVNAATTTHHEPARSSPHPRQHKNKEKGRGFRS
jgi:hypothetical protein